MLSPKVAASIAPMKSAEPFDEPVGVFCGAQGPCDFQKRLMYVQLQNFKNKPSHLNVQQDLAASLPVQLIPITSCL